MVANKTTRIVGGEKAPRPYPYQISLQVKVQQYIAIFPTGKYEWMHNCGGSIVSETCVLTAAHCVVDYKPEQLSILAGTNQLHARGQNGERVYVREIHVHPNYQELVTSDIAVMKINSSFSFGERIAPIKYSSKAIGGGENCTLTGWGYTNPFRVGLPPNDLQRAFLPTLTNEECREAGMNVTNTEICTYSHFLQGACGVCFETMPLFMFHVHANSNLAF